MKQIFAIILLISVLLLSACGSTPDEPDEQPKIVIFEDAVMEKYDEYIQQENETGMGVECYSEPILFDWQFENMTTLTTINVLIVPCMYSGCYGPCDLADHYAFTLDNEIYFVNEDETLQGYFDEIFEPIDTLGEASEYIYFSGYSNLKSMELALMDWDKSVDDCEFYEEVPEYDEELVMLDNGNYLYGGFGTEPVGEMRLYYYEYTLTPDGQFSVEDTYVALCGQGIIY